MADQARSLHTQELHHAGDGAGHPLTKKQRLPSQLEHELQQAADGEETGLSHDSNSADQQANQHEVLTETAQAGFHMLESRVTTTDAKIEELTQAGVQLLDGLKEAFLQKMQEYKERVHQYAHNEAQKWGEQSSATQQAIERLHAARQLVSTLGFKATEG